MIPFQHVHQQDLEPVLELAPFAAAHGIELLGEVVEVELIQAAGAHQRRLLLGPGKEVLVVEARANERLGHRGLSQGYR